MNPNKEYLFNWISPLQKPDHGQHITIKTKIGHIGHAVYDMFHEDKFRVHAKPNDTYIGVIGWVPYLPEHNTIGFEQV